jgi:hypothetical protein
MRICGQFVQALEKTATKRELYPKSVFGNPCALSLRMEYPEYDFTRNPVVEDQVFFLESKCIRCGFTVLVRSLEELLKEEKRHRPQCTLLRATS